MSDEIECRYTTEITCPHCGHATSDSWEAADEDHIICDKCGNEYKYTRDIEVTYVSEKLNPTEGE